jgi:hypothetical protein
MLSYHPEMPWALARIERDEPFIRLLDAAVTTFSLELERQFQECVRRGWVGGEGNRASGGNSGAASRTKIQPLPPLDTLLTTMANKQ